MRYLFFLIISFSTLFANAHIFVYHRFADDRYQSANTTIKELTKQFEYFKNNNYKVVPLLDIVQKLEKKEPIPNNWIALTIDDAYKSFYEHGLKVGIVTGAGREGVNTTLENHGFEKYVSVIVSGDDVKNSKPAPDCYLLAADKLGLQPSECLAIEDTYNGSISAIRANIKCIGVSPSHSVRNLFSKTVYECSDLTIATQWILQNFQLQATNA